MRFLAVLDRCAGSLCWIAVLCFGSLCRASDRCAVLRIAVLGIAVLCWQRWAALGFALIGRYWAGTGGPCWRVGRWRADFLAAGGAAVLLRSHAFTNRARRSARISRWTQAPPAGCQAAHAEFALWPGCLPIVALDSPRPLSAQGIGRAARRREASIHQPGGQALPAFA